MMLEYVLDYMLLDLTEYPSLCVVRVYGHLHFLFIYRTHMQLLLRPCSVYSVLISVLERVISDRERFEYSAAKHTNVPPRLERDGIPTFQPDVPAIRPCIAEPPPKFEMA
jgi:hypothetical protein